jgi:integrase
MNPDCNIIQERTALMPSSIAGDSVFLPTSGPVFPNSPTEPDALMKINQLEIAQLPLADFVERRFIPEHVLLKRSAGRSHFYWMLKLILTPERVDQAFLKNGQRLSGVAKQFAGWPYLDEIPLGKVTADDVTRLIAAGLERHYSVQTVTHIRNVVRCIYVHAIKTGSFEGKNPASFARLPEMVHSEGHALTLSQFVEIFPHLGYPERELSVVAVASGMSIAEICGLQWKHVNLTSTRRKLDDGWSLPRTISVRIQSYRAELSPVTEPRRRDIPISDVLAAVFSSLRMRRPSLSEDDFVFTSRSGTPVSQENIGARRLKPVGVSLGMPWLSWSAFHRTHVKLMRELGSRMQSELKRAIPIEPALRIAKQPHAQFYRKSGSPDRA